MTIDPISSPQISALGRAGDSGGAAVAGESARSIAVAVVGHIAGQLLLAPARPGNIAEKYGVRALADTVAAAFPNGNPAAVGALHRAMESFAGAVAADMAAFADGRTLDRVDSAIADFAAPENAHDIEAVRAAFERAAAAITDAR
uniref:hypothetical protein n=1 Tax=Sphingomonas populi TaxID=2484750 RepID=UPI0013EEBF29|nr:hypothetical protein [Sphingomonas populi]